MNTRTGEIGNVLHHLDSSNLPAGHLLVRCNNRRTTRWECQSSGCRNNGPGFY
ncbi:hypothetical protein TNCT6_35390 [Streptomyces sp. 6-11-2]|nr:hypothetical protein TNCT6_35390 [Streptomyces sp. 6-11-2]